MHLADWPPPAGNLAGKIASMFSVLNNGIHTFVPELGLVVYAGIPDSPTSEALVCLAEAFGVPCERHQVRLVGSCAMRALHMGVRQP